MQYIIQSLNNKTANTSIGQHHRQTFYRIICDINIIFDFMVRKSMKNLPHKIQN